MNEIKAENGVISKEGEHMILEYGFHNCQFCCIISLNHIKADSRKK